MAYGSIKADLLITTSGNVDLTAVSTSDATTSASGNMSAADKTKLDAIEASATADQTGAEIKSAYEGESDTNAFTDAEKTKLTDLPTNASLASTLTGKADASIYATAGITSTSLVWDAPTIESVNIVGTTDAFASSSDVNIADGNVQYFTDAESATAVNTVNLRWDGSNSLDSKLSVGHSLSTTLIVASTDTTRAPSVIATIQIDGSTVAPLWQGNSAAPEDDAGGTTSSDNLDHDVYSLTIIKTASATFTVLAAKVRYGLVPD